MEKHLAWILKTLGIYGALVGICMFLEHLEPGGMCGPGLGIGFGILFIPPITFGLFVHSTTKLYHTNDTAYIFPFLVSLGLGMAIWSKIGG